MSIVLRVVFLSFWTRLDVKPFLKLTQTRYVAVIFSIVHVSDDYLIIFILLVDHENMGVCTISFVVAQIVAEIE